jgi:hypothetical protein
MGGLAVKAPALAKRAITDKGLLPHLSDLVGLSERPAYRGLTHCLLCGHPLS